MPNASAKNGQVSSAPDLRHGEQPDGDGRVDRHRDRQDGASRVPVGEMAGGKREQRERNEHREPDEPEVERVAVDLVDLPADRDERHLDRERVATVANDVQREVAML